MHADAISRADVSREAALLPRRISSVAGLEVEAIVVGEVTIGPPPATSPGENSPSMALTTAKHTTATMPADSPILKIASPLNMVPKTPVREVLVSSFSAV
ncbi:hypothetical protein MKX08_005105 [Trichoderma sp. CBMAI-0020]|nr:hypothetical protein MKX08_005105 [Trichoderma sp. CBMAI-0020]